MSGTAAIVSKLVLFLVVRVCVYLFNHLFFLTLNVDVHEPALEHVVGEEGAEVPDVRKVVHRGAAAVEGHPAGLACALRVDMD